jgi:hypothetical protein
MQSENTQIDAAKANLDADPLISKILVYLEEVERRYQLSQSTSLNSQETKSA